LDLFLPYMTQDKGLFKEEVQQLTEAIGEEYAKIRRRKAHLDRALSNSLL
jgi:hypothetical protein